MYTSDKKVFVWQKKNDCPENVKLLSCGKHYHVCILIFCVWFLLDNRIMPPSAIKYSQSEISKQINTLQWFLNYIWKADRSLMFNVAQKHFVVGAIKSVCDHKIRIFLFLPTQSSIIMNHHNFCAIVTSISVPSALTIKTSH